MSDHYCLQAVFSGFFAFRGRQFQLSFISHFAVAFSFESIRRKKLSVCKQPWKEGYGGRRSFTSV